MLKRLRQRLGNPLEWSLVDRSILAALIVLPFAGSYAFAIYYYLLHPEIAPFANRSLAELAFRVQILVVGGWLALVAIGLALRRSAPQNRLLLYALCQLYGVGFGVDSYWLGHYTSLFTGVTLIGGVTIGLVLLERRPVLLGAAAYVAIVVGTTLAERAGLLPYAPAYLDSPVKDGRMSGWWLATIGGVTFVLLLVVVAVIDYIVREWRAHELKLAQTSDQLARANELVSRYVAAQVAEQIFAGNYSAVDRHERRKLTLFFSDIKGFSAMADRMEPEDVSQMLNEYLSEMSAIAQRYGGTIDKFIGDALMVFFGAPMATEDRDHAVRAVRMAIEMQARVQDLSAKWVSDGLEQPFEIRIGINSGVASVGNFGSKDRVDYTAIGRQVNLAARLQVYCEPGRILLSHSTWVLVRDQIACTPKGEIQVKGIHSPVKVYEVTLEGAASAGLAAGGS